MTIQLVVVTLISLHYGLYMICPFCKSTKTKVVDKRDNNATSSIRRRRECLDCLKRFTTYEKIQSICLNVIKRSGKIEDFDREKLKRGILTAIKKRRIPESTIDSLVADIESTLLSSKTTYIKSIEIGELVLNKLKDIDKVGYLLYASVYKDFRDLNDFQKAINELNI